MTRPMKFGVTVLACALLAFPAFADNFVAKDGQGVIITKAAKSVSGALHDQVVTEGLVGGTGAPQAVNVDSSGNVSVNCASGCSGSGTSTLANASPTTVTEGSTTTPLSLDLSRNLRVVFSNTSIAATQSGTWNVTNISGTVSLPTGAATSANQTTANSSLSTIATNSGTQATAANQTSEIAALGAPADSAAATDTSTASLIGMAKRIAQNLSTLNTTAGGAIPAGTNIIGKVGIDQTTPGTTNGVQVNAALPAGTNLMGKVGIDQTTPGTTNGVQDAATSATGSAVPSKAGYVGANSSGNLTGLIQADASAAINVSTATTTQIVALSSSKKIYVTSFDVIAGGTGNITFEYGTGSNCGTGTTVLTGAYNLTAQAGIAKGNGLGPVLVVPASNALCVLTSAAVQMSGSVAYTQF